MTSLLAHLAILAAAPLAADRPNIVFIVADDLGYECLGANGGESYRTPRLDALAREGVRFERCFATPLCTPTRVALMTGRYGFRTGQRWGTIDRRERTFAQLLREAGYATAVAGKWQLADFSQKPDHPRECGFDEHCLWTWSWKGRKTSRYWSPHIWRNGRLLEGVEDRYGPDLFCEFLIDFMRRNRERPFLAYYPMALVHAPFEAPPGAEGSGRAEKKPRRGARGEARANFPDMVAYMDGLVGKIVGALDDLGLREKTLIVFTGDNGTPRGIRSRIGGRVVEGGKGTMTGLGTHVPLIASLQGTAPAGRVAGDLIDSSDFLPTLLEAAGAPLPAGVAIDGRSFLPQVRGEPGRPRQWVYLQLWEERCVRDARFELHGDGRLFDLAADPLEERALDPKTEGGEARAARERLGAALRSLEAAGARGGRWPRHTIDDTSKGADGVRLADANGDGLPDVAAGWEEGGVVRVYLNPGPARARQPWPRVTAGPAEAVEDAFLADLDGDGALDLVSASEGRARVLAVHWAPRQRQRLLDPEAWKREEVPASRGVMAWMYAAAAQVDGKNGVDLVAGGKGEGAAIGWFAAPADPRGLAGWTWHPVRAAGWVMSLVPLDMDADGDLDLLASDRKGPGRGCFWLENPGAAEAARGSWREHPIGLQGREVMFVAPCDLDGDRLIDVAAAVKEREIVYFRRKSHGGTSWESRALPLPPSAGTAKAVQAGDLDLDGRPDLVYTCEEAGGGRSGLGWLSFRESPLDAHWESHPLSGPEG